MPINKEGLNLSNYYKADDRTKQRLCLRCGQDFTSFHSGHRLCGRCENQNSFQNDRAGFQPTGFLRK